MAVLCYLLQKDGSTVVNANDVYCGTGNKENKFHFSFLDKWYGRSEQDSLV